MGAGVFAAAVEALRGRGIPAGGAALAADGVGAVGLATGVELVDLAPAEGSTFATGLVTGVVPVAFAAPGTAAAVAGFGFAEVAIGAGFDPVMFGFVAALVTGAAGF